MRLSPVLADLGTYPFVRLDEAKRRLAAEGVSFVDFGVGDPREPVAPFIRQALVDGVEERMGYPLAQGLPELRRAIADWCRGRFGVDLDPGTEVIPTLGAKEAIFSLAQVALDIPGGKDLVVVTEPGYPVQERGALFAGGRVLKVPLLERNAFRPDLDAIDAETWARIAVFWVNYPNNPTGSVAPLSFFERLAELAAEHDFLLASDEAYTELYFGEPPPSVLQLSSRRNVAAFNTLSKRSSMTGYRSGFVAGDPELIGALRAFRPTVGTAPQEFVQRAAIAAWGDEAHVEQMRAVYGRKREILLEALREKGIRVAGGEATMYLWLEVPGGGSSEAFATGLLEHGVVVAPGAFFGPAGEGYVRIALVPTEDECRRAAEILRGDAVSVEETIAALDRGERRVAEKRGDEWVVDVEAKQAILDYFGLRRIEPQELGPFEYSDKIPLKHGYAELGVRVVPPATARYGSFLSEGVVLMPSYVNIGAWVGPRTMVDTWATVGSCAQIGADVHLAGGVGIGGVLEPVQASPVIVEDGAFIGSRCILTEGVRIGERAVLAPNVSLTASVPVIDVTGPEPVEYRGFVPPYSVVVPGSRSKEFPAGTYEVACALIIGRRNAQTDLKTSLNDALREFEIGS